MNSILNGFFPEASSDQSSWQWWLFTIIGILACFFLYVCYLIPDFIKVVKNKNPAHVSYFITSTCLVYNVFFQLAYILSLPAFAQSSLIPQIIFGACGIFMNVYMLVYRFIWDKKNSKNKNYVQEV